MSENIRPSPYFAPFTDAPVRFLTYLKFVGPPTSAADAAPLISIFLSILLRSSCFFVSSFSSFPGEVREPGSRTRAALRELTGLLFASHCFLHSRRSLSPGDLWPSSPRFSSRYCFRSLRRFKSFSLLRASYDCLPGMRTCTFTTEPESRSLNSEVPCSALQCMPSFLVLAR